MYFAAKCQKNKRVLFSQLWEVLVILFHSYSFPFVYKYSLLKKTQRQIDNIGENIYFYASVPRKDSTFGISKK